MKIKSHRIAAVIFCGLLALAACAEAFGQRPGGDPPGGPPPDGPAGFPPGGVPGRGPGRRGEQGPPPGGHRPPPPFGPHADLLSAETRFGDRLVKGAPFSAQFVTESTQTLGDGTRITRKSSGAVYRNAEGQTRRELTFSAIGPVAVEGGPKQVIFINDFAAHAHYVLDDSTRTARKLPLLDAPPDQPPPVPPHLAGAADPVKTESLGRRTFEGVEAEGTRAVVTIPAGRIGNDRPLEIVSERWYSPELQVVVLVKHSDPFVGENVYRLTNISRNEPARTLFDVPADYTVVEGGPPPRNPERRPRP